MMGGGGGGGGEEIRIKAGRSRSSLYRDDLPTIKETIRIYFTSTSEVCRNKREKQMVDPAEKSL